MVWLCGDNRLWFCRSEDLDNKELHPGQKGTTDTARRAYRHNSRLSADQAVMRHSPSIRSSDNSTMPWLPPSFSTVPVIWPERLRALGSRSVQETGRASAASTAFFSPSAEPHSACSPGYSRL